jgi:hypothetical protein
MLKKILIWVAVAFVGLALLMQLIPYGRDHNNPPVLSEPNWDSPATHELAKRACFDCHSNETTWPWYSNIAPVSWLVYHDVIEARDRMNFSEWGRPQPGIDQVIEEIEEGGMPLPQYLLMHPNARLSAQEREALIEGLRKSLQ